MLGIRMFGRKLAGLAALATVSALCAVAAMPSARGGDAELPHFIGHTMMLTFELQPHEAKDRPWSVVTATTDYGLRVQFSGQDANFHLDIRGKIVPLAELHKKQRAADDAPAKINPVTGKVETVKAAKADEDEGDEEDDGNYLVTFTADLTFNGNGNEMTLAASGSRVISSGDTATLALLGDKTLIVKVVDAEDDGEAVEEVEPTAPTKTPAAKPGAKTKP